MAAKLIILCATLALANAGYLTPQTVAYATPAITSQSANILRSPGNLAQISTFSKTIDTPYSSVRKSDVRISNPGIYTHAAPVVSYAAAAPALTYTHAAPVASYAAVAPAISYAHAAPAVAYSSAPSVSHVSYSAAPVAYAAAPAFAQHVAPLSYSYGPSYADHAVGATHESTIRSLGGNSAVTHYSKAVDTAFSSVRKSDTRITNDAKLVAAAPALTYAAAYPTTYAAAPLVAKAYGAPGIAYSAAPVVAHATYAAPAAHYSW